MRQSELKPCLHCASGQDERALHEVGYDGSDGHTEVWRVQCSNCDAIGPEGFTREEAIAQWNNRPREAELEAEVERLREMYKTVKQENADFCKAVSAEPELTDEMPDEMYEVICKDKDAAQFVYRQLIKDTKRGIVERIYEGKHIESENETLRTQLTIAQRHRDTYKEIVRHLKKELKDLRLNFDVGVSIKCAAQDELQKTRAENQRLREALAEALTNFQPAYEAADSPEELRALVVQGWECLIDGGIPEYILKALGGEK